MSRDRSTSDLFADSTVAPGSLASAIEIAHTMGDALKRCAFTREEVAERMGHALGKPVTVAVLNAYTAPSRDDHNISLERAIAFDAATGVHALLHLHARKCDGVALLDKDKAFAELGRLEHERRELAERERALRTLLRVGR